MACKGPAFTALSESMIPLNDNGRQTSREIPALADFEADLQRAWTNRDWDEVGVSHCDGSAINRSDLSIRVHHEQSMKLINNHLYIRAGRILEVTRKMRNGFITYVENLKDVIGKAHHR
jgi:hypothetical protein